MLHHDGVYMLAADHRWQLEEWCDAHQVARTRIPDLKSLVFDGFVLAHGQSALVRERGALLLDAQYSAASVAHGRERGFDVGCPAERAGAFPLRWATTPLQDALQGTFVKVLVRHRPDYASDIVDDQLAGLKSLQAWCEAAGQPLVLEVLVPRAGEPEDAFETTGRAAIVADYIRRAYAEGVVPAFWKMEGTTSAAAAQVVDLAVREREGARFLVLGKGAGLDLIGQWFAAARTMVSASGFAVGRSIYMAPSTDWLLGRVPRADAVERIASTYLGLIEAWNTAGARTQG